MRPQDPGRNLSPGPKSRNTTAALTPEGLDTLINTGDLSTLSVQDLRLHYLAVCRALGVPPELGMLGVWERGGHRHLYARPDLAYYLARVHNITAPEYTGEYVAPLGVYQHHIRVVWGDRCLWATGAVAVVGMGGSTLASALMAAETKAYRRGVLRIMGLSILDDSEVESIPGASRYPVTQEPPVPDLANAIIKSLKALDAPEVVKEVVQGKYGEPRRLRSLPVEDLQDILTSVAAITAARKAPPPPQDNKQQQ